MEQKVTQFIGVDVAAELAGLPSDVFLDGCVYGVLNCCTGERRVGGDVVGEVDVVRNEAGVFDADISICVPLPMSWATIRMKS